jgi:hypothetical protein
MLETMYVRCTHCGYDNSPEYRFCGMCGASLAHPPAAEAKPVAKEVSRPANGDGEKVPVHGPSFLGLSEDPKVEFHYLYEDEQPRSHVGLVVFLLIILGAAGYLAWQWRQGGFPFNRQSSSSSGGAQQSASPSEVAPAMNQNQQTHIDKPMTGAGDVLPTAPDQKTQADPTGRTAEIPVQGGQNPATTPKSGASSTEATPSANESAEDTSTEKAAPPKKTEKAEATPPPNPAKSRGTKETAMRTRVPSREPQTAAPATPAPDADLELAGERYLYGTGVPQNCPRAESSLRTAAMHGNTKAQTVLGTMYATGHCVGRDLPTAYRWFARALHQDPQNSRISADLQVLWRQMTPQEKQLATASGQ